MIKAIIFDFDGVILESAVIKTKAYRLLFEQDYPEQVQDIVDYHLNHMGISRYVKFKYFFREILHIPLSIEKEKELGEKFSRIVLDEVIKAPFVPGTLDFLKNNHNKYALFVASGTPESELQFITERRGLSGYFQEIHGTPKEKKDIITDILSRHHLMPEEVAFVGDAITDWKAAEATGLHFIARLTEESDLTMCEFCLDDLQELSHTINDIERKL